MAGKKLELGATGQTVSENVTRVRTARGLNYTEVSKLLEEMGRSIPPLAVRRIEAGQRRVDADDLMALAVALGVSPVTLLMPDTVDRTSAVKTTGVVDDHSAEDVWKWLRADNPLNKPYNGIELLEFIGAATPTWRAGEYGEEVLKLLELQRLQGELQKGGTAAAAARKRMDELMGLSDGDD